MKKSEAYRRYTILVSGRMCEHRKAGPPLDPPTFILQEIAHAGTAGEDELRDVLDDFGLVLGCERGKPLG